MPDDVSDLTREQVVERARGLVPGIRERAAKTEALRRIPEETIAELRGSGLLRLAQPRRWGGPELSFATHLDVITELGLACGSTAWTCSLLNSHVWQLGLFGDQAQHDVWGATPDAVVCMATLGGPPPRVVPGGVHITEGRWHFLSGVHHADWIAVNATFPPGEGVDGPPDIRCLLIPRGDYEIVDDWYVTSLAGTGSCGVVLHDVFVPEHRTVSFQDMLQGSAPGARVNPSPAFRLPLIAYWPAFLAAPAVAIARGALDTWAERMRTRTHAYTHRPMAQHAASHIRLGRAGARIDAATELIRRGVDELMRTVVEGAPDPELRTRNRRDFAFAASLCVEAVEDLFLASGAGSLAESSAMQRHWRDVHGIAQHVGMNLDESFEAWGRWAMGIDARSR